MMFNMKYRDWFFETTIEEDWLLARKLGILDPRLLDGYEVDILSYRAKPAFTIGIEIEQYKLTKVYWVRDDRFSEIVKIKKDGFRKLQQMERTYTIMSKSLRDILYERWGDPVPCESKWMYDGSGPAEWSYGISKIGANVLKMFLNDWFYNSPTHYVWEWRAEYLSNGRHHGCGSHTHLRPVLQNGNIGETWATAWNTVVTLLPFMMPFFVWKERARLEASTWARPYYRRYAPATIEEKVRALDGNNGRDNYCIVSLTGITYCPKPLTIEIRISETHPTFSLAGMQILNRIIGGAFKRGYISPKVTPDTERKLLEIEERVVCREPVYEVLEDVGPIEFLPGRGIPGIKKLVFKNAWEVTKAICNILLRHGRDVWGRWTVRVAKLISERGIPAENSWACWRVLEKDFNWEEPEIDMSRR